MTDNKNKQEEKNDMKKEILSWIFTFITAIIAALLIVTFIAQRVIGLPGETIQIDDKGTTFINGNVLDGNYGREVIKDSGLAAQEITLGENEYWVMGDNRNHSCDSRVIGPIPKDRIVGKAIFRIYPFNQMGMNW